MINYLLYNKRFNPLIILDTVIRYLRFKKEIYSDFVIYYSVIFVFSLLFLYYYYIISIESLRYFIVFSAVIFLYWRFYIIKGTYERLIEEIKKALPFLYKRSPSKLELFNLITFIVITRAIFIIAILQLILFSSYIFILSLPFIVFYVYFEPNILVRVFEKREIPFKLWWQGIKDSFSYNWIAYLFELIWWGGLLFFSINIVIFIYLVFNEVLNNFFPFIPIYIVKLFDFDSPILYIISGVTPLIIWDPIRIVFYFLFYYKQKSIRENWYYLFSNNN